MSSRSRSSRPVHGQSRRRRSRWILGATAVLAGSIALPSLWAYANSRGRINRVTDAPSAPAALVLGAGVRPDGQPSGLLAGRLDIAAKLYTTGRVDTMLVSGATGADGYDEPRAMRDYLIDAGVPASAIHLDDQGDSTWESCVRARDRFGYDDLLVVSQRFHLPRAVALCRAAGLEAHGVAHESARSNPASTRLGYAREVLASVPAMVTAVAAKNRPVEAGTEQ